MTEECGYEGGIAVGVISQTMGFWAMAYVMVKNITLRSAFGMDTIVSLMSIQTVVSTCQV